MVDTGASQRTGVANQSQGWRQGEHAGQATGNHRSYSHNWRLSVPTHTGTLPSNYMAY